MFQLLFLLLFRTPKPDFYLVQNPPSIPTLFIVWMAARLQGARFVIDWHNFGFVCYRGLDSQIHHHGAVSRRQSST